MEFIASKKIIHRNLAARNILLINAQALIAKISDFGLSCTCDNTFIYEASLEEKLPLKWLSIEAIVERKFSEKSDVWAFGILMYELFSGGEKPYGTMNRSEILVFLQSENRLDLSNEVPFEITALAAACWTREPEQRATFQNLVEKLRLLLSKETESYGYLSWKEKMS